MMRIKSNITLFIFHFITHVVYIYNIYKERERESPKFDTSHHAFQTACTKDIFFIWQMLQYTSLFQGKEFSGFKGLVVQLQLVPFGKRYRSYLPLSCNKQAKIGIEAKLSTPYSIKLKWVDF